MKPIHNYILNNVATVVEVFKIVVNIVQLVVTAIARLGLPTKGVVAVHDFLKKFESPLDVAKSFLLKNAG